MYVCIETHLNLEMHSTTPRQHTADSGMMVHPQQQTDRGGSDSQKDTTASTTVAPPVPLTESGSTKKQGIKGLDNMTCASTMFYVHRTSLS